MASAGSPSVSCAMPDSQRLANRRPAVAGIGGRARTRVWPASRSASTAAASAARTAGATLAPAVAGAADQAIRSGPGGGPRLV